MKKQYIIPAIESFEINTRSTLCLSKGDNEENGVADSRKFWGNSLWEEDSEEDDKTAQVSY